MDKYNKADLEKIKKKIARPIAQEGKLSRAGGMMMKRWHDEKKSSAIKKTLEKHVENPSRETNHARTRR